MGISLHFFLTAMFSWTLVEAWHLYLALVEVFCAQKKSLLKRYYILGYGNFLFHDCHVSTSCALHSTTSLVFLDQLNKISLM